MTKITAISLVRGSNALWCMICSLQSRSIVKTWADRMQKSPAKPELSSTCVAIVSPFEWAGVGRFDGYLAWRFNDLLLSIFLLGRVHWCLLGRFD